VNTEYGTVLVTNGGEDSRVRLVPAEAPSRGQGGTGRSVCGGVRAVVTGNAVCYNM
jgi:hypothetical protein